MHDLWRMKLVVISHACVTPQNQAFFQHISEVAGWNVTIILPKQWKTDFNDRYAIQKLPGFKGEIIPVSVHLKGRIPLHFYHFGLFRAISRERPDIIYVHNESYALSTFQVMLFNFLFLRKTVGFYAAQNIIKKYLLPFRLIEKFNFRQADYCFPVTESAAVALREKGFAGRIAVLPLGVTENHVREPAARGVPKQPFVIGYVGRLVPEKGIDVLLRSLALLQSAGWECRIIGEGRIKDDLLRLGRELCIEDKTCFLGYVGHGEVSSHIAGFSVLILPSRTMPNWTEQFGRVIIEALAAGVPVIGTNSGEIPFLIRKLQGGVVIDEGDPQALALAIDRLISDPALAENFVIQGRENVRKYFLERKIAGDFVTEISAAMAARRH
jgi:glycosyltransferase involved in cell wall biosynthesis